MLPHSFAGFLSKISYNKRIREWIMIAPHLIRPIKIIYFGKCRSKLLIRAYDFFKDCYYSEKSVRVDINSIPLLRNNKALHPRAWLTEGYKVNVTRLKIELLKEIFTRGGIVLNFADLEETEKGLFIKDNITGELFHIFAVKHIICHQTFIDQFLVDNLPCADFVMHLDLKNNRFIFTDEEDKLGIIAHPYVSDESIKKFLMIDHGIPLKHLTSTQVMCSEFDVFKSLKPGFSENFSLLNTRQDQVTRSVEDIMETAFDLAKQTGIVFSDFRKLYYSYGQGTEWMTNRAYEFMQFTRDPQKIWQQVEREYMARFEWAIDIDW